MDFKRFIDHGEGLRTAKAAGPSFSYVNLLTLTFGLLRVLTLFFFRHLRFQGLQEKLLLAPSSAKIVHSASAPAWEEDKVEICYHTVQIKLSLTSGRPETVMAEDDTPRVANLPTTFALGLWQCICFARATCAWTLTISTEDTALPLKLRVLTRLSLGFAPSDRGRFLSL